jgi:hypothetical protein
MQSDIKSWSQKWEALERSEAARHAAFARLPRATRERAFEAVRARTGSATVHIEQLIEAAIELREMI